MRIASVARSSRATASTISCEATSLTNTRLSQGNSSIVCWSRPRRAAISASGWTRDRGNRVSAGDEFHAANQLVKAENAYRQILKVDARHARTLYVLGQLSSTKGDHWAAADTYRLACGPSHPSRSRRGRGLAIEHQALNRHAEAADAFRKLLELNPNFPSAQYGLGRSLGATARGWKKAAKILSALQARSDASTDPVLRAKARMQLNKLKQDVNPCYIRLDSSSQSSPTFADANYSELSRPLITRRFAHP